MKISIGTNIKNGPWGGGNLFAINLRNYLLKEKHQVVMNLLDDDIDVILLTEPRKTSESSAFTHIDVERYRRYINPNVVVVHRINECDERKNTDYVNQYLVEANKVSNYTIFVSTWLRNLFLKHGISDVDSKVILAGANKEIFNSKGYKPWNKKEKLKIVTHHWGANWNKGFREYTVLDKLLEDKSINEKFEFTYIGNIPKEIKLKNTKVIAPLSGERISNEIKKSHIYLTASLNEPSGNHHIEAAQCGLPLLYINSGGIPEYCDGFGIKFDNSNFIEKLYELRDNYDFYFNKLKNYPQSADKMSEEYLSTFNKLVRQNLTVSDHKKETSFVERFQRNKYLFIRNIYKGIK